MKGIILKNLYGARPTLLLGTPLLLVTFYACVCLAWENADLISFLTVFYNYAGVVVFSSFILNSFASDEKCGWIRLERAMPISAGRAAAARLLSCGVIVAIISAIVMVMNIAVYLCAVYMLNANIELEVFITAPIVAGLLQLIALSPVVPVALRYGSRTVNTVYLICVILMAIAAIAVSFPLAAGEIPPVTLRLICYAGVPAAAAATAFLSYLFAKKAALRDL